MNYNVSVDDAVRIASEKCNAGAYSDAEKICHAILNENSTHPDAYHILGVIAFRTGQYPLAVSLLETAIKYNKKNPDYYANLGNAFRELGEFNKAIRFLKKSIKINAKNASAHFNLANAYRDSGKQQDAIRSYLKAIQINPSYVVAINNLAVIYKDSGQYDEAIKLFKKAIDIKPDYFVAINNLAITYANAANPDEALLAYQKAIAVNPDYAEAYYNMGNLYNVMGNKEEAIRCFTSALEKNSHLVEAENNLGVIYFEIENHEKSLEHFERAIAIDPSYKFTYLNYGNLFRKASKYDEAIRLYKKAIAIDPEYVDAYYNLGCVCFDSERSEDAIDYFKKVLELNPVHAPACKNLGNTYKDFGRIKEAISAFESAIKINPAFTEAYRELTSVKKLAENAPEINAMLTLYASSHLGTQQTMHLAFALGKVYEGQKNYNEAFRYLYEANKSRRELIPYEREQNALMFEKIEKLFASDYVRQKAKCGQTDETPIFILGMPRSGSSLVEQILASHSDVYGAGELNYTSKLVKELCSVPSKLDYPDCIAGIDQNLIECLGKEYLSLIRQKSKEARFITDKMPQNFLYVGLIKIIFPRAKIIHTSRNPIDNCWSIYKHGFYDGHAYADDLDDLADYYVMYRRLMDHWKTLFGNDILDIQYEDIVRDQKKETARLLEYCDLEWQEACLDYHNTQRRVHTASATQVRKGIYTSSIGAWKPYEKHLTPLISALANHSLISGCS